MRTARAAPTGFYDRSSTGFDAAGPSLLYIQSGTGSFPPHPKNDELSPRGRLSVYLHSLLDARAAKLESDTAQIQIVSGRFWQRGEIWESKQEVPFDLRLLLPNEQRFLPTELRLATGRKAPISTQFTISIEIELTASLHAKWFLYNSSVYK